ncbi:MAG TPA: autotransporter domain-containing protein, partial [Xanthobacteraceae bacterium]|nr:autotransporter domain-containing protein [Xanthobacteraceae bacterium]
NGRFDISGLNGGTSIASLSGSGAVALGANTLTLSNASGTFSGAIDGTGGLTLTTGTETLSGTNPYSGATTINGGSLNVTGSITGTSSVTVNSGGTLGGTGIVDPLTVTINSGATFVPGTAGVPGTSITIAGNLAFASGALYVVYFNPTTSTFANVTGSASLAGTVLANFASGNYVAKQYTILTASGGVSGTFSAISNLGLPAGARDTLSYSGNDVFLNLVPGFTTYTGLTTNQQNVANALGNYFNNTGGIPSQFFALPPSGLSQLDGEAGTGAERSALQLTNEFLQLMLDPFVYGRGSFSPGGQPLGFAPDRANSLPPDIALAYAGLLKAPPKQTFDQRWTAWGAGFGGSSTANGDPIVGSNNVTTSTYGYAAGMDYHYSPDTVLGFSFAGGGTNWNLANALGTGRSDAFLAGVYGVTHAGPAYLATALAFANNWFTTSRTALGDQLTANFQGQSYAARLEGGYRFLVPMDHNAVGLTPYAAIQAQDFHTPTYSETDLSGGGFGLSYNAMNGTDTRSELGGRFDDLTAVNGMPLILRAKLAWAHDFVSNPALNASFEALPGASFTVNGAPIPHDSALASAGAQLFITPNWSFLTKFDGEFASGSQLYAGSGTLRYTW